MRMNSVYPNLVLLLVLFCFCNGEPNDPYSDQEVDLLFNMLESLIRNGSYQPSWWKTIQKAFEEKRKAKINGFSNRRSIKSLKQHFLCDLNNDKVNASKALRELYKTVTRTAITCQERDFINRELLQSGEDLLCLYSIKRWKNIQKRHEEKQAAGNQGFSNKRSWRVLLNHFRNVMMPKNLVLDAVKQKFSENFENEQGLTLVDELLNECDGPSENLHHYSEKERELMFKILESQVRSYKPSVWKEIQQAFEEKMRGNEKGFYKRRPPSVRSLQLNFLSILKSDKILVSDALREVCKLMKRSNITPQEREFINKELLRSEVPTSWRLTSTDRWKKIEEKHAEKRESGTLGFENNRSWLTLRNHFYYVMKSKSLVDKAVKKRFPDDFENDQGAISNEEEDRYENDPGEDMECNEEDDVWDPILEDLENTQRGPIDDYGVDHNMFVDSIQNNSLYMDHSPYELRTFEPKSP